MFSLQKLKWNTNGNRFVLIWFSCHLLIEGMDIKFSYVDKVQNANFLIVIQRKHSELDNTWIYFSQFVHNTEIEFLLDDSAFNV